MRERLLRYRGDSMGDTFRHGEILRIEPLRKRAAEVGDVVVYRSDAGKRVVHRVSSVLADGRLLLRGDAHSDDDAEPVRPEHILGRVTGTLRLPRAPADVPRAAARLLGPPYRWLAKQPQLRRTLRALLRPDLRYLDFGGDVITVVHRRRIVARLFPRLGRMHARAPWALLVDPPSRREGR